MRSRTWTASAGALLLAAASLVEAKNVHDHLQVLHKRHRAHRDLFTSVAEDGENGIELRSIPPETATTEVKVEKRGGQCVFPTDAGLVAVTPDQQNAGWAMSPNQPCLPGNYCPYACPPGEVSMQWNPAATAYTYPISMDGGLYCDDTGAISKPFPDQPYCQAGTGAANVNNKASGVVAFCQTVLPGNEAMLIPTSIEGTTTLAVPGTSYWLSTAAHYYINGPGVTVEEACVWGTSSSPIGNWSPYVAGANTDATGNTFVKLGWNPVYLEQATPFRNTMPTWGVEITCSGGNCNGLPCAIDPSQNGVNEMIGSATDGAGGAAFCVVTVPKGATATFEVFEGSSSSSNSASQSWASSSKAPSSTAPSSTSSSSPSWSSPSPSSSSSSQPASSSSAAWTPSSSSATWSASPVGFYATSGNWTSQSTTSSASASSSSYPQPSVSFALFNENSTETYSASGVAPSSAVETSWAGSATAPSVATITGAASTTRISIASVALSLLTLSLWQLA